MMFRTTNSAINLEIIDYENPQGGSTHEDRNLLLTNLQLVDRHRRWDTIAPFLYTWEVRYLINWLSDLLADREVPDRLSFVEPCITIQLRNVSAGKDAFCFWFSLLYEATPPWWNQPLDKPYTLTIECTGHDIEQAIHYLAKQVAPFAVRG